MNININLTLIVQIFLFLAVYYLLKKLLFKPLVSIIELQQHDRQRVLKKIQQAEQELLHLQQKQQEQWQQYYLFCAQSKPLLLEPTYSAQKPVTQFARTVPQPQTTIAHILPYLITLLRK